MVVVRVWSVLHAQVAYLQPIWSSGALDSCLQLILLQTCWLVIALADMLFCLWCTGGVQANSRSVGLLQCQGRWRHS